MGDWVFDFDELDAALQKSAPEPVIALDMLTPQSGEVLGGQLCCSSEPRVFCIAVGTPAAGGDSATSTACDRGTLVLNVRLKTILPQQSLFVCISKTGRVPEPGVRDFHWLSGLAPNCAAGWCCRIQRHRWRFAAHHAVVLVGISQAPLPQPYLIPGYSGSCVSFTPLDGTAPQIDAVAIFEASVVFEPESSLLPMVELATAHERFHSLFNGIDAKKLSVDGTALLQRTGDIELTYGEVEFAPFWDALSRAAAPRAGETFVDLGSGSGRALVAAALGFPCLQRCIGYEVVPTLLDASRCAARDLSSTDAWPAAPIEIREADFCECHWEVDADIVWVSSLCMSKQTISRVKQLARGLRHGARILTMDQGFGEAQEFERIYINGAASFRIEMSFGDARIYAVRRI